jgi:hypothetical protein
VALPKLVSASFVHRVTTLDEVACANTTSVVHMVSVSRVAVFSVSRLCLVSQHTVVSLMVNQEPYTPQHTTTNPNYPAFNHQPSTNQSGTTNSVAVASAAMLEQDPNLKIGIVDLDVHHGNGTDEIVKYLNAKQQRQSVRLFSIHAHEEGDEADPDQNTFYPYDTRLPQGTQTDTKADVVTATFQPRWAGSQLAPRGTRTSKSKAAKSNVSKEMSDAEKEKANKDDYRKCVATVCTAIKETEVDIIFISAGFDAGKNDIGCGRVVSILVILLCIWFVCLTQRPMLLWLMFQPTKCIMNSGAPFHHTN